MKKVGLLLVAGIFAVLGMSQNGYTASLKFGDTALNVGGSARLDAAWRISDLGDVSEGEEDSVTDFELEVPFDSMLYIGAENGNMSAYLEVGVGFDSPEFRMAYATYSAENGFSLMVGRNWSIIAEYSPSQKLNQDDTLVGFGDLYNGLTDQIRFIYSADELTFQLALEKAETLDAEEYDTTLSDMFLTEAMMPAVAASLAYDNGTIMLTPSIYAQQYSWIANATGVKDIDITCYAIALNAAWTTDFMVLSGELWYGSNVSTGIDVYSVLRSTSFGFPALNAAGNDIEDVDSMGGWIQAAIPVSECKLTCGLGYQTSDVETLPSADYESDVSTFGAFVNYEIPLAPGFTITPEIVYYDYGDAPEKSKTGIAGENSDGSDILVGVHFQYDF